MKKNTKTKIKSFVISAIAAADRTDKANTSKVDMIIPLAMLMILPLVYHGFRVVVMVGVSIASAMLFESVFCLAAKRKNSIKDLSCVCDAMCIAMLLPVSAPIWLLIAANAFAIWVAKMPFGGYGKAIFSPAASAIAFVTVLFPQEVFRFRDTKLLEKLAWFENPTFQGSQSPAELIKQGIHPELFEQELLFGNFPGALGTTAVLVIFVCMLYLMLRKAVPWQIPVFFVVTSAAIAFAFPRVEQFTRIDSVVYELVSGSLIFVGVFVLSERTLVPKNGIAKMVYAIIGAAICMILRYCGIFEQGACFAVMMMNISLPLFDRVFQKIGRSSYELSTEDSQGILAEIPPENPAPDPLTENSSKDPQEIPSEIPPEHPAPDSLTENSAKDTAEISSEISPENPEPNPLAENSAKDTTEIPSETSPEHPAPDPLAENSEKDTTEIPPEKPQNQTEPLTETDRGASDDTE